MQVSLLFDIGWKRDRSVSVVVGIRKGSCFANFAAGIGLIFENSTARKPVQWLCV